MNYPEYLAEFDAIVDVPDHAMTIDYLIGDPARTGQGLGSTMIRAIVDQTWRDWPETPPS